MSVFHPARNRRSELITDGLRLTPVAFSVSYDSTARTHEQRSAVKGAYMGEAAFAFPAARLERPARLNTHEHCVITRQCGSTLTGILVNLSEEGFCLETPLRSRATSAYKCECSGQDLKAQ